MKLIYLIDSLILFFVKSAAHFLEVKTGKNNFWFSRLTLSALTAIDIWKGREVPALIPTAIVCYVIAIFFSFVWEFDWQRGRAQLDFEHSRTAVFTRTIVLVLLGFTVFNFLFFTNSFGFVGVIRNSLLLITAHLFFINPENPDDKGYRYFK